MNPKVNRLENIPPCHLGEGPHWDVKTQSLYFVDILQKVIHRYVPSTKQHFQAEIGTDHVSLIIPINGENGKFLISIGRNLAIISWDGESNVVSNIETILEVENDPDTLGNRWNDGKCDPSGRLWAGTMEANVTGVKKGSLYTFQNKKLTTHLTKIGISNGLAFNKALKKMYYIDSMSLAIESYDFDIENGTIANKEIIFTASKHFEEGGPDGMTIDTDGNLWVAIIFGSRIVKLDPRKPDKILATIPMPAKQVTSLAFGGPNLDELYATTARMEMGDEKLISPDHGGIYRITGLNVSGFPGVSVVL